MSKMKTEGSFYGVPLKILVRLLRLKLIPFENIKVDFFKDQDVAFQYYDFEDQDSCDFLSRS